jgi:phospholipase A1
MDPANWNFHTNSPVRQTAGLPFSIRKVTMPNKTTRERHVSLPQHPASRGVHWRRVIRGGLAAVTASCAVSTALAQEQAPVPAAPAVLSDCARIADNSKRLACFDEFVAGTMNRPSDVAVDAPPVATKSPPVAPDKPATRSLLDEIWETRPENKRGTFVFRPHQENYLLFAKYSTQPNDKPFEPLLALAPNARGLSNTELAFQLSFKTKMLEDLTSRHADLWFGYTQQSFWQAYSKRESSPFRETNYQPELMLVAPTGFRILGMDNRFINLGLAHQSNGQPSILSRSWNRVYLQTGFERGDFTLLARVWKRLSENRATDDNPDILDYMGHGDLVGTWRRNGHQVSMLVRRNLHTDRGAVQVGWAFPLVDQLKGYVQVFSGYGQSLIDYNSFQRTLGLGVMINY